MGKLCTERCLSGNLQSLTRRSHRTTRGQAESKFFTPKYTYAGTAHKGTRRKNLIIPLCSFMLFPEGHRDDVGLGLSCFCATHPSVAHRIGTAYKNFIANLLISNLQYPIPNPDEPEPRITLIFTDFLFVFSVQSVKSVVNFLVFCARNQLLRP